MELTKKDTKMIQGLSVLAMVWLHLFDTLNYNGVFQPLVFFRGVPLVFFVAQLADFCVMGFAFCSGYAHYTVFGEDDYYRKRLRSLLKLFVRYWVVLIVFTVISIIAGKGNYMPGSLKTFLLHLFFLDSGYNGAWWYLFSFIVIVLISPFLLKNVQKQSLWIVVILSGAIYCLSYYYRFHGTSTNLFLTKLGPLGMTVAEYLMGAVAAKTGYFSVVRNAWNKFAEPIRIVISIGSIFLMLFIRTLLVPSLFVAPVTGLAVITLFVLWKKPVWIEKVFLLMGKHSTHIWLIHMFFYLYLFKGLVYTCVYPLPIYLLMIAITLSVSIVLNYIEETVYKLTGI